MVTSGSVAPVLAVRHAGGLGRLRRLQDGVGEDVGDAVLFERDQADRLLRGHVAEAVDDAGRGQAVAAALHRLDGDQLAVLRAAAAPGETVSSEPRRSIGTTRPSPSRSR